MGNEETPLIQARQLMASHLPEYRPFALQEIVRAAKLQGGTKSTIGTNPLNVPAWLDIFLYCAVAFIISTAIFMGLYTTLVRPYRRQPDEEEADYLEMPTTLTITSPPTNLGGGAATTTIIHTDKTRGGKREMLAHVHGPQLNPPHPPPPMLPARS